MTQTKILNVVPYNQYVALRWNKINTYFDSIQVKYRSISVCSLHIADHLHYQNREQSSVGVSTSVDIDIDLNVRQLYCYRQACTEIDQQARPSRAFRFVRQKLNSCSSQTKLKMAWKHTKPSSTPTSLNLSRHGLAKLFFFQAFV